MSVFINDRKYEVIDSSLYLDEIDFKKFSDIKGIENLKDLKELSLSGNFLEDLDGIEVLENLEVLYLKLNYLEEINHINKLKNLKELNLDDNGIRFIRGLDNLTNLEILSLSYNDIEKIENLENLKNLKELYLDYNSIKEIEGLEKLTNLKTLCLNANEISEIKELEDLVNLDELYLDDNPFKEEEEKYLIDSDAPIKAIIYYCRTKKLETDEIKLLKEYDENKRFGENIDIFKRSLQSKEISEFINIGTHLENKEIAIMQNLIFYDQIPEEIYLQDKAVRLSKVKMSLLQINSLKNVKPVRDDKIGHFLFFVKQFWDDNEIKNNALVYNQNERLIDSKIKEFLKLSLLTKPDLIVFPENSVPYRMIDYLIKISKENNLVIVCGLEHQKNNSNYINRAIIIDNGEYGEQIKQTPVEIKRYNGNNIREKIECATFPKIKIFLTSIGRVALLICKDYLRLSEKIAGWARKNKIDYLIIPSLTSKILPFHTKLINLLNYTKYDRLKIIFSSIAEYGGSEFFSIDQIGRIEKSYRYKNQDNIGEVIVPRRFVYYGKNVTYDENNGYVYIKCRNCNQDYAIPTNKAHILLEDAPDFEKNKWEFYLQCQKCGFKNYRY